MRHAFTGIDNHPQVPEMHLDNLFQAICSFAGCKSFVEMACKDGPLLMLINRGCRTQGVWQSLCGPMALPILRKTLESIYLQGKKKIRKKALLDFFTYLIWGHETNDRKMKRWDLYFDSPFLGLRWDSSQLPTNILFFFFQLARKPSCTW